MKSSLPEPDLRRQSYHARFCRVAPSSRRENVFKAICILHASICRKARPDTAFAIAGHESLYCRRAHWRRSEMSEHWQEERRPE